MAKLRSFLAEFMKGKYYLPLRKDDILREVNLFFLRCDGKLEEDIRIKSMDCSGDIDTTAYARCKDISDVLWLDTQARVHKH